MNKNPFREADMGRKKYMSKYLFPCPKRPLMRYIKEKPIHTKTGETNNSNT